MSTITITAPFHPETGETYPTPISKEILIGHLRKAIELMNDGGKHWTRGAYIKPLSDGSNSYCALGAIGTSVGWSGSNGENEPLLNALSAELLTTLGEEVTITWLIDKVKYGQPKAVVDPHAIIAFNDDPGRTWVEVRSLFESTIERLEKEC